MKISENNTINNELNFKNVSEEFVTKQINKLNAKKATGHDGISPKILKMAQQEITNPITKLVNKSIDSSIFPADLKSAQVSPLYKKKITLSKKEIIDQSVSYPALLRSLSVPFMTN